MNILRFEMNVPTEIVLQSLEGVAVEGRYGCRVMFNLVDGRVMYVPPIVAEKIAEEGVTAGEPFQLRKAFVRGGQRRSVEWIVERGSSSAKNANETRSPDSESPLERDLRASVEIANGKKTTPSSEPPSVPKVVEIPSPTPSSNNGHGGPGENGNSPNHKALPAAPVTKLEQALKTAISAAHNAEKFGSEIGYVVRFDADAIKSMAITVLINMSERSPR